MLGKIEFIKNQILKLNYVVKCQILSPAPTIIQIAILYLTLLNKITFDSFDRVNLFSLCDIECNCANCFS